MVTRGRAGRAQSAGGKASGGSAGRRRGGVERQHRRRASAGSAPRGASLARTRRASAAGPSLRRIDIAMPIRVGSRRSPARAARRRASRIFTRWPDGAQRRGHPPGRRRLELVRSGRARPARRPRGARRAPASARRLAPAARRRAPAPAARAPPPARRAPASRGATLHLRRVHLHLRELLLHLAGAGLHRRGVGLHPRDLRTARPRPGDCIRRTDAVDLGRHVVDAAEHRLHPPDLDQDLPDLAAHPPDFGLRLRDRRLRGHVLRLRGEVLRLRDLQLVGQPLAIDQRLVAQRAVLLELADPVLQLAGHRRDAALDLAGDDRSRGASAPRAPRCARIRRPPYRAGPASGPAPRPDAPAPDRNDAGRARGSRPAARARARRPASGSR